MKNDSLLPQTSDSMTKGGNVRQNNRFIYEQKNIKNMSDRPMNLEEKNQLKIHIGQLTPD